jgi:alpha-L-rhamnosidase
MHSGFAAYFYESLGGIKSSEDQPGFKAFTVNPEFSTAITNTEVKVPTPYGDITNNWSIKDEVLSMNLEVPFNTKARVLVTPSELESLKINGAPITEFKQNNPIEIADGFVILGSGDYTIAYSKS